MKRTALLATLALVAVTPAVANAGPKASARTLTYDYAGFQAAYADGAAWFSAENPCLVVDSCWDFSTNKGEKTIKVSIADDSGQPVAFQIWSDDDYDTVLEFCGTGEFKVSPKSAAPISVRPSAASGCAGLPTSGTVTAVITNK